MEAIPKPAGPVRSARGQRNPGNSRQGRCHGETKLALHESHSPTPGTKLAQHESHSPTPGTKLALHESHSPTPSTKLALHESHGPTPGTKLALLARNGSFWRVLRVHGELSTVFATNKPRRANFVPNTSWMRGQHTQQHTRPHRHKGLQRNQRVTAVTTPGKVARNSIAPTLNRSPETLKFQRREFMV